MKLYESILLSAAVGFFIIAVSQVFYGKFAESYWVSMLALICLLSLRLIRYLGNKKQQAVDNAVKTKKNKSKNNSPKGKK